MKTRIPVFDLHSDIPVDIARRRAFGERAVFKTRHFERLVEGGIQAAILVLWVEPEHRCRSAQRIVELLGALIADLHESSDCVELVSNEESLKNCIGRGKFAVFLGVEGMTFVEQWSLGGTSNMADWQQSDALYEKFRQSFGILNQFTLRHAILVWGEQNQIASGPGTFFDEASRVGLTDFGRHVVQELDRSNIIIDVSHLDETSTEDVLTTTQGVVIASHSNARALCDHPRNLSDRHICKIGDRGGVIGINAYANFIDPVNPTVDRYVDHVVYIANLIGIEHVALGFDFMDYLPDTFGFSEKTTGLTNASDVPGLIERLYKRGFTEREVEQLAFQNALRIVGKDK
ncbi:dipeptidase [Alicyclobacillus fastidiosus]|uniref:Membrane dipeptidase n=1 Tax=Alicyclobacillus fastidiosus TaxID=392011 RepID=A0ABV5AP89_9BACL|nr:membrane dipeptidase [Alicyclobacillus fastidiosus]WEH08422.1 membrane dipeptidase [Alicyclobacillus fastidiosus]